ncbi:MAG: aminodeoxychorismate synthase component I [Acidimicrobiia bacterium]|nr:aminodeoxychorismate synthase component I [Acidimicrobiia bacterium]
MKSARFDDLRPHRRRSFQMVGLLGVLEAGRPGEVGDVLNSAEKAVRDGHWVAGFVTYEASPSFDPSLVVVDPTGSAMEDLPLAWFSVWERRAPTYQLSTSWYELGTWTPASDEKRHAADVSHIKQRIRGGDTYQVNHTFRMTAAFDGDPEGLYRDLVNSQSCGYGALIDTGRFVVASASPELFFEWRHGVIQSKPMKGTAPRGLMVTDDEEQRRRLEASEKDQAENLMIVDMVRNDLGRVARVGSVRVPALFTTEKYDTVWQLTSTVVAETRPATSLSDVFTALFPCASITGAPKVSTMGIIKDLEADPRGVYCGAIGFGGPGAGGAPEWAFNVAIRTVLVDRAAGLATYGTGGGVTYDSTPEGEYDEALLKVQVLARRSASLELIETIKWSESDGLWLLDRHLERLTASARYFDIPLDPAEVRAALRAAVAGRLGLARLRLTVDRTGKIAVEAGDLPRASTVRAAVDSMPIDPTDPLLYHKTTNRRTYDEARARYSGVDDVILINPAGEVTETTVGNLAVELDGSWWTPPVSAGLLPGTYRAELLATGRLGERSVAISQLKAASGLARLNALRGWEPIDLD